MCGIAGIVALEDISGRLVKAIRKMGWQVELAGPFDGHAWRRGGIISFEGKSEARRNHASKYTTVQKDLIDRDFPVWTVHNLDEVERVFR